MKPEMTWDFPDKKGEIKITKQLYKLWRPNSTFLNKSVSYFMQFRIENTPAFSFSPW